LATPLYSDGARLETSGFFGRRVDLKLSTSYATGTTPFQSSVSEFRTYSGEARLQIGLARDVAVLLDYLFYEYAFDPSLPLPPGFPHHMTRSGARIGLTLWLPAFNSRSER
jgi:hypothetical protein